jgi:hypothetical protein
MLVDNTIVRKPDGARCRNTRQGRDLVTDEHGVSV